MATAKYFAKDGTEKGSRELPAAVFGCEVNEHLMYEAVRAYSAKQRQGNASTKERSDVRGGGKKPYRQKGTGRARAGTIRSPIWRGGGIVFGPHPRDYRIELPKKIRRGALLSALSSRALDGDILIIDDVDLSEPKTKAFAKVLKHMDSYKKKTLFLLDAPKEAVVKSARNIPGVKIVLGKQVSVYDVMWADKIIITEPAVRTMEEVFKA
ncbi:MAG: 50S ribosomal protein L4 [Chitinivibrionia bacterium]|nr:50S ribosomal protein L4 [Chitinivibrionia bacterium]